MPSVGKEPSLSVPLGQRVGGQDMKTDFPALDFLPGDVAPGKRPAVSGGNGYSTLAGERLLPACRTSPDDMSSSPSRVRRCQSQLVATNGLPVTAVSVRIT